MPALVAPVLAFVVAAGGDPDRLPDRRAAAPRPGDAQLQLGQIASGGLLALAHGTNDAQKTMGVITLALIANGNRLRRRLPRPDLGGDLVGHARSRSAPTSAAGGSSARWARRIIKMDPAQGFAAQGAGADGDPRRLALRLSALDHRMSFRRRRWGPGRRKRLSAVRWGIAGNIVLGVDGDLAAAGVDRSAVYGLTRIFGTGALGPALVS